jgi:IS5 family transposase
MEIFKNDLFKKDRLYFIVVLITESIKSLLDFALQERYRRVSELGDKVAEFDTLIEWECYRPLIGDLYTNTTYQGGQPNFDEILMVKLLVLQSMYGLSDPELERLANDRISFLKFLGFPEKIPDQSTIWYFRERLIKHKKLELIWEELRRQENNPGLKIKKGTIQDATFITVYPGHAPADKPRGEQAKTVLAYGGGDLNKTLNCTAF